MWDIYIRHYADHKVWRGHDRGWERPKQVTRLCRCYSERERDETLARYNTEEATRHHEQTCWAEEVE